MTVPAIPEEILRAKNTYGYSDPEHRDAKAMLTRRESTLSASLNGEDLTAEEKSERYRVLLKKPEISELYFFCCSRNFFLQNTQK